MAPSTTASSLERILLYPTTSPYCNPKRELAATKGSKFKRYLPEAQPPLHFKKSQHPRTTSAPSTFPNSYQQDEHKNRLSMDILLDAIDLDLNMRRKFKEEWLKTQHGRYTTNAAAAFDMSRRRSRSAPSALPSYYFKQQKTFNSVWTAPGCDNRTVTSAADAQVVAENIVKQHLLKSSIVKKINL